MADVTGAVRVLVVDDDPLVRSSLRLILGASAAIEIVAEAADGRAGIDAVRRSAPDVVLLDLRMPGVDGLQVLRDLRADGVSARVLVLTTFDDDGLIVRALRAGAAGFLLKDTPPDRLVDAVLRVGAGEPVLSPAVTARLIESVAGDPAAEARRRRSAALVERLTPRERDVAVVVAEGLSNGEAAARLGLSPTTVKGHVAQVLAKLGVPNRVGIARVLYEAGTGSA